MQIDESAIAEHRRDPAWFARWWRTWRQEFREQGRATARGIAAGTVCRACRRPKPVAGYDGRSACPACRPLVAFGCDRHQSELTEAELRAGVGRGNQIGFGLRWRDAGVSRQVWAWRDVDPGDECERWPNPATWCPGCNEPDPDAVSPTSCTSCAPLWQALALVGVSR